MSAIPSAMALIFAPKLCKSKGTHTPRLVRQSLCDQRHAQSGESLGCTAIQHPNLLSSAVRQRIATLCRASFSPSDAANVGKVGASRLYGGTFARLMNSKTKISQRHVLNVGIKTCFLALRLSRFVMGNCHLSSEWSWTKKSCGNSGWMKRLRVKNKPYTTFTTALPSVLLLRAVRLNLELVEVRRTHWVPLQLILEA
jgi:hypothetical protein